MTVAVRPAMASDDDLAAIVRIVNAASPEDGTSVADLRWADATYPGIVRFIADLEGHPVGAATVGRIYMYPPEFDAFWATIDVLLGARRQGIGGSLLAAAAASAAAAGKTHLHIPTTADRPDAVAFLERRGFLEYERTRAVRLELAGRARPADNPPDGIELTDLAARPDLVAGVHAVALETFPDIPGGDRPMAAGELAEFRARDVDRPGIPPDAFGVAVERTGGVVGYAALMLKPGDPSVGLHDMTAVARAWRRRGLAGALKRRTIGWAIDHGLTALETGNDEGNHAMQGVNARLGYRPLPDLLTMRGPLDRAMMTW